MEEPPLLLDLPDQLVGERVILRPYRPGDGRALFDAIDASLEHLRPRMPWIEDHTDAEASEARVRRFDARWRLREDLALGIWEKNSERFLGGTGLHRIDWQSRRFEIGYWIREDAQGRGFVTETAELLCGLAFETLSANRVIIRCAVDNVRSAAVPRRLGFIFEGTLHNEGVHADGKPYDMYLFAMTPEVWRTTKSRAG